MDEQKLLASGDGDGTPTVAGSAPTMAAWAALERAERNRKLQIRGSVAVAVAAIVAGTVWLPWGKGWCARRNPPPPWLDLALISASANSLCCAAAAGTS